jgi:hypothetical protein
MLSNQEAKWMREFKVSKIRRQNGLKIKVGDKSKEIIWNQMKWAIANY